MAVVSYNEANAMLIAIINADAQRRFLSGTIDSKKASPSQIKEALLLSDSQVVMADIDNPYHYRNLVASNELDHGAEIPGAVPRVVIVMIKVAAADTEFVPGIRGKWGWDQIERWRRNHNAVYGPYAHDAANSPLGAKICLKGNRLGFTGTKAVVMRAPAFVIDRATPACQADQSQTPIVVSGGVFYLHQEGMVSDMLFQEHAKIWQSGIASLNQRAIALLSSTDE